MPTVLRLSGLNVVIYPDDHEPAHVHVRGDGEAKISLEPSVRLDWERGMSWATAQKAVRLVAANREMLLRKWNEIHG
ncbi:MAG: DUF4160 domain-containing protein [Rhizobiaceae bacterium]|nr:DUF4160 domain-containing protein [Rhizobiaceae bacterium]